MKNLFNNQLKYLSFNKYTVRSYSSLSSSSRANQIISWSSLVTNKNILSVTKEKHVLTNLYAQNQLLLRRSPSPFFMFTRLFSQGKFISKDLTPADISYSRKSTEENNKKNKDNLLSSAHSFLLNKLANSEGAEIRPELDPRNRLKGLSKSTLDLNKSRSVTMERGKKRPSMSLPFPLKKSLSYPKSLDFKTSSPTFSSDLNLKNIQARSNRNNQASLLLSKNTPQILNRRPIKLTEKDWKEMWSRKFTKFNRLGLYAPNFSDKLLFAHLNERNQNIKSKYTFNNLLSGSQLITYNFNKNIKKIDLNSLYKYLKSFFRNLSSLISFPTLENYPDKLRIRLFFYVIPSTTKKNLHKSLHRYIRSDEKLYKEMILKRKFKNVMEHFKMKLFIAKWKEDNYLIRIPNPISFFKELSVEYLTLPVKNETSKEKPLNNFEQLNENLNMSNDEFNRSNETTLDLLKLDLSKLSQQHDQLKSLFGFTLTDKTPESFSLQSDHEVHHLDPETDNNIPESLKSLTDRKVSTIVSLNKEKFKYLIFTLEKLFKKTIILDLVRLKYPYHESNILAQVLGLSSKTKNFRDIMKKLLYTATITNPTKMVRKQNFTIIPSYLSGLKVRLGGRLITQRVVPRFTVQSFQIGSLARGKINFTDSSRITLKNKRGAFSFTVTTSHIFDK
uniref:ribosomal protein S3 n=1 Tax=Ramaria cf. rubripermanens TaxID=2016387 RepID=UPI002237ADFC|nr:ribosomal protein S3 [Ramaria cf. rubripermanens]UYR22203.1 ribosomal protein S3 [Ramaria cf. rubripermanens]